jgi:phage terminase large subunit GpA-like protein
MVISGIGIRQLDPGAHADELRWMVRAGRTPRLRTHREFAEQEIVLPNTGPKGGRRFRCEYQPFTGLWFDAIGSGVFNRFVATGPSQSGKTLNCFVEPIMYHLFEKRENVIAFAPNMDICEDKWLIDVHPTIANSRFAEFLPRKGGGSKDAFNDRIQFTNGTYLKWMTAGGGDKNKAAITAKVACGTEVNDMREGTATSVETGPIGQIEARLLSHGARSRLYMECTVDVEEGVIWQEWLNGTASKIVMPCAHCDAWVTPERGDFTGWESAENELEAEKTGRFFCPSCGGAWSPDQRRTANQLSRIVHKGQQVTADGSIVGPVPETRTFGFRWSAINNLFAEESHIGSGEWKAARNPDRDSAEKFRQQFIWCIPWSGDNAGIDISDKMIASRLTGLDQCVVPDDYETLVCKIDLHNRWHYWTVVATSPGYVRSVVDYGITWTPFEGGDSPEEAIRIGLELVKAELADKEWKTVSGDAVEIDLHSIDAGYYEDVALKFATENGPTWILEKGKGDDYRQPAKRTDDIVPGNHWYFSWQPAKPQSNGKKWWLAISETNYWMKQVHGGFRSKTFAEGVRRQGSMALFGDDPKRHSTSADNRVSRGAYASQLVAWRWDLLPNKGATYGWVGQYSKDGRDDHFFDTTYGCFVADQIVRTYGARFRKPKPVEKQVEKKPFTMPDGRPYLLTER